jgi:hypothetical protein
MPCPLRARQSGRSRSRTVANGEIAGGALVSGVAGDRRSAVPTSQADSVFSLVGRRERSRKACPKESESFASGRLWLTRRALTCRQRHVPTVVNASIVRSELGHLSLR